MKPLVTFLLILLFASTTFSSCKKSNYSVNEGREKHYKEICFTKTKSYQLSIDSIMLPKIEYLDYDDEMQQLNLLNVYNNNIYKYQINSDLEIEPFEIVDLKIDGRITGFIHLGIDSILVIDGSNSNLMLLNHKEKKTLWSVEPYAEIRNIINLYLESGKDLSSLKSVFYGTSYVNDDNRFIRERDKIYFPLLGTEPTRTGVTIKGQFVPSVASIDLKSGIVDYVIPFSEVYEGRDWGNGFYFRHSSIASFKKGKLLVSFPADHNLFVWDFKKNSFEKFYAGAYAISEIIPKNGKPEYIRLSDDDWGDTQPRYRKVLYDKYKNIIYRIATLPSKKDGLTKSYYCPIIVVVLDGDMNYLGEWTLPNPEQYGCPSIFVSKEGLNIQRENTKDEGHIFFEVFEPQL